MVVAVRCCLEWRNPNEMFRFPSPNLTLFHKKKISWRKDSNLTEQRKKRGNERNNWREFFIYVLFFAAPQGEHLSMGNEKLHLAGCPFNVHLVCCKLIESYVWNLVIYYCGVLDRVFSEQRQTSEKRVKNLKRSWICKRNWYSNTSVLLSTNEYISSKLLLKHAVGEREKEWIWYFMPFSSHVVDEWNINYY